MPPPPLWHVVYEGSVIFYRRELLSIMGDQVNSIVTQLKSLDYPSSPQIRPPLRITWRNSLKGKENWIKTKWSSACTAFLHLTLYNTTLIGLLDKHAPLKTRTITIRPSAPWYTEDIREEKQKRRALERRLRRTGLTVDRERFVDQCQVVNEFILQAKTAYYSRIIDENQYDPKRLFSIFDKLLHRKSEPKLPDSMDDQSLANTFRDYFIEKITTIREELQEKEVLQTTSKLNCCTVALGLITSSQYHVMNCLTWFLDRLWSPAC